MYTFKQYLRENLKAFPKVGTGRQQKPDAMPYKGKKNTLPKSVHHTRFDQAKHMAEYEDEDSTNYAYSILTHFNQKEDGKYENI